MKKILEEYGKVVYGILIASIIIGIFVFAVIPLLSNIMPWVNKDTNNVLTLGSDSSAYLTLSENYVRADLGTEIDLISYVATANDGNATIDVSNVANYSTTSISSGIVLSGPVTQNGTKYILDQTDGKGVYDVYYTVTNSNGVHLTSASIKVILE